MEATKSNCVSQHFQFCFPMVENNHDSDRLLTYFGWLLHGVNFKSQISSFRKKFDIPFPPRRLSRFHCFPNLLTCFMSQVSFYTPLKASENERFSDVFRG